MLFCLATRIKEFTAKSKKKKIGMKYLKKTLKINGKLNFTKTFQLPKSAHRANKNILKASKDGNRIILQFFIITENTP